MSPGYISRDALESESKILCLWFKRPGEARLLSLHRVFLLQAVGKDGRSYLGLRPITLVPIQ